MDNPLSLIKLRSVQRAPFASFRSCKLWDFYSKAERGWVHVGLIVHSISKNSQCYGGKMNIALKFCIIQITTPKLALERPTVSGRPYRAAHVAKQRGRDSYRASKRKNFKRSVHGILGRLS